MQPLKIGIGVSSVGRFLPFVAQEAGLFEKAGLSVEIVNRQDEEKVVADMVAGETPIATPNAPSLLFSILEGNDLVIAGGVLNRPGFYLTARPGITTIADLGGSRVGINQPRRMAGLVMLALLRKWGLDPEKDLTLVELGINDKSMAALQNGELDAALLPPEKAFLAAEEGCNLIADSLELDCHWVPLATSRRFFDDNRELVHQIADIYRRSIAIFKGEPELTLGVIKNHLPGLAHKPGLVGKVHRFFAAQFEPSLMPSERSLKAVLAEVVRQDARAAGIQIGALSAN